MTQISIRVDEEVKQKAESACADMGLSLTAAINIYLKKLGNERRIPFEVSADPFYSERNTAHLMRGAAALNAGKGREHDLIEAND